ncbi:hypothetical protein NVP1049O_54 [Vibrio phage 1.049.O._10N.286.54.B5]|nr:hypothetical protein NVP1049O_54 [Vibrio phage 1.049.O._10N.286.54.B5]AUR84223.1 hypothetical protein NVP1050O_54 [Vibrio phage 1.050.O._10N.286.48.A6]
MNTILTIKEQNEFLSTNLENKTFEFKWSCRGYGSTTVFNSNDNKLLRVGGCGFDRRGAALGQLITLLFKPELDKLAKKVVSGRGDRKVTPRLFYGLSVYKGRVSVDGACGFDCMQQILAAIGFEINLVHSTNSQRQTGSEIFELKPIDRKGWYFKRITEFKK